MQSSSNNTTLFSYRYVYMCYATFAIDMGKQLSPILLHSGIGMSKAISKVKLKKPPATYIVLPCQYLDGKTWISIWNIHSGFILGISIWDFSIGVLGHFMPKSSLEYVPFNSQVEVIS